MKLPRPELRRRRPDAAVLAALSAAPDQDRLEAVVARVLAARELPADIPPAMVVAAPLSSLDPPEGLPDMAVAAARLADAVEAGEVIGIETDHDVDGVASHALLFEALGAGLGHPVAKLRSYIGHRLRDGYGLSEPVATAILEDQPQPSLVITADNGSSDEPRIRRLAAQGIDVIVTDHHALPVEGPPASALACVSPARSDSEYPDAMIAGCMVAWLLVCACRRELQRRGWPAADAMRPGTLLDLVALGTVVDCVSLGRSINNRAVVRAGLQRINTMSRPCWQAMRDVLNKRARDFTASDLAFGVGPRINARGRLDEAMAGVHFLRAADVDEAREWAALLEQNNTTRRQIEQRLRGEALAQAAQQVAAGQAGLTIWLPEGHAGVHGIVASRVVEAFGRPAVCLSPRQGHDALLTGSVRGVSGVHVRQALQCVSEQQPDVLKTFGGHAAAGGLTLERTARPVFARLWDDAVRAQIGVQGLLPVLWTDGELPPDEPSLALVARLAELEPYGRGFEPPVFEGCFEVVTLRGMGDGSHLRLRLRTPAAIYEAVWFQAARANGEAAEASWPVAAGEQLWVAYVPEANHYFGEPRLQLRVVDVRPLDAVMQGQ